MDLITLEQAKEQCRVENSLEDDLLTLYIGAAQEQIEAYLNSDGVPVNSRTKCAALMIVEDLYKNRGAQLDAKQFENPAIERLLFPLRQDLGL